jgi:SAM-dependent methyltransferase
VSYTQQQAKAFGAAALTYERARPGYPEEAVDWLLPDGAPRVVDLGAGTGKLTRQIAARGVEVTAVEPSDRMREQLQRTLPDVRALAGAAEQLPLEAGSVDAVLVAQAWHWVDVPRASAEVARVLRAGGHLGLIWNSRDERVDWVRRLTSLTPRAPQMDRANPDIAPPFRRFEHHAVAWSSPMTPESLIELAASRSGTIIAPAGERERMFGAIRELAATHPDLAGRDTFELPYVTYCTRAFVD